MMNLERIIIGRIPKIQKIALTLVLVTKNKAIMMVLVTVTKITLIAGSGAPHQCDPFRSHWWKMNAVQSNDYSDLKTKEMVGIPM